jgi:8-oxo-dGTP pyrophosphatase MutT (NUDIX family)
MRQGIPEFLLTTAKRRPDQWVLPKGRIEVGERPDETAVREVMEETGVTAAVEAPLGDHAIVVNGVEQRVLVFLMQFVAEGPAHEGRSVRWLPDRQSKTHLTFDNQRTFIQLACERLSATARPDTP